MKIDLTTENKIKAFFTPIELAKMLSISKPTIYRLIETRKLPFHKIGGSIRFYKADIDSYLETNRVEPIR